LLSSEESEEEEYLMNKVSSFAQVGMTNPLHPNKSFDEAICHIDNQKLPKGVYRPTAALYEQIMVAITKFSATERLDQFLLRFGLVE